MERMGSGAVRRSRRRLAAAATAAALGAALAAGPALAQDGAPAEPREVLARMSAAERVGQVILAPFWGAGAGEGSQAATLVQGLKVGGLLLSPARGNFSNTAGAPLAVAGLARDLQARAAESGGVGLLLAIGPGAEGESVPALRADMTPLPSPLALGATWEPELAEAVGALLGRELAAAGLNLLLGPGLDVADEPRPASSGDLGVRSYGGSAAWVARFGQRFIAGVHRGSLGRVSTAAGSFPGTGGADRSQAEDLPVVEGTLPDLAAVDLVPFAAVTGDGARDTGRTDALLTSHVRYRGVQQQADRPISLDSGGLRYLWAQVPALTAWREDHGVLISPPLGAPAVRRYLDPSAGTVNARRVVREALAAGNDILNLSELGPAEDPEGQLRAVQEVVTWLASEYEADPGLREAVDAAALRVLTLKQRAGLLLAPAAGPPPAAADFGRGADVVAQVARQALTQIAPGPEEGGRPVPASPRTGERLLWVVDARELRECAACPPYLDLDPERLVDGVRRAYGPAGTGRLARDEDVAAITFRELKAWLQAAGRVRPEDTVTLVPRLDGARAAEVGRLLRRADWLVFAMRDVRPAEDPGSDALKLLLRATAPDLAAKRKVVLAFAAPYYLDATEIAQLTAYYAVYSRGAPFIDVAVRALFGDQAAEGASPVSVPGARYELARAVEPALDQVPSLELVGHDPAVPLAEGARFLVRSTTVRDRNGHPVPDGTRVRLRRYDRADGVFLPDIDAVTLGGRAAAPLRADRPGVLEVSAVFDNGLRGEPLALTIERAGLFSLPPPDIGLVRPRVAVDWGIFVLSLGLVLLAGVLVYAVDSEAARTPGRLLHLLLLSLCWGLAGYLLVAAGGLHLEALGPWRLWPGGWSVAYQAPLASFALALVPIAWALRRGARRASR